MDVQFARSNVGDVVILEVEHTFGVFNDGGRVGCDEELDGLRETIFGHECAGLRAKDVRRGRRHEKASRRIGRHCNNVCFRSMDALYSER